MQWDMSAPVDVSQACLCMLSTCDVRTMFLADAVKLQLRSKAESGEGLANRIPQLLPALPDS